MHANPQLLKRKLGASGLQPGSSLISVDLDVSNFSLNQSVA
jgi:hypothetical protein